MSMALPACPNPDCHGPHVIRNGSKNGRKRFHCRSCGRFWGETQGKPVYGLRTPVAEIAQALLLVMRRGSLRGAEEITGACCGPCGGPHRGVQPRSASQPGRN